MPVLPPVTTMDLGFHIILACLGIALPTTVLLAEFTGLRRGMRPQCG
jgi:hypothetical protein